MFYAVKVGKNPGIYRSWVECEKEVKGFSGAIYKKFKTLNEAEEFVGDSKIEGKIKDFPEEDNDRYLVKYKGRVLHQGTRNIVHKVSKEEVIAYVDGSYEEKRGVGYGSILILNGKSNYIKMEGRLGDHKWDKYRNVTGELVATLLAVEWAAKNNKKRITVYHDYEGIAQWALGTWKAKNELTQKYVKMMKKLSTKVEIHFKKVSAHTGDFYNEVADRLAKI